MATSKIRAANNAPMSRLAPGLPATHSVLISGETTEYTLQLLHVQKLSQRLQDAVYRLFDLNMGAMIAESSFKTTEAEKREELFEPTTRYLLATRRSVDGQIITDQDLLGYLSFRFDTEETLGERDAEVIYCYELQVAATARGFGIGKSLLLSYEQIGSRAGMQKAMLTLLNSNTSAAAFYKSQGYTPDEIDPTLMATMDDYEEDDGEEETVHYTILSKKLK